ncbi:hypothetical protein FIBSPDRAFT_215923 [Athelia psychrophila]|uniref:Uncharacterized protein n=1 Tax=Athelia psychrophila TaxID=1759441 RepID=A0A166SEE3_9AGAM|nr:hypothetical protein FIBSPDRAFT_215923 [Fibularhizoctonia sp. CBS 109695]
MHSWRLSCGGTSWDLGSTERDGVRWAYCEQNTYVKSPQKSQLTPWLETRSGVPCTVQCAPCHSQIWRLSQAETGRYQ